MSRHYNSLPLLSLCLFFCNWNTIQAQTSLIIQDGELVQSGGFLVLENAKFINNADYTASDGTVSISGNASDANSSIGGTSMTTFYNLKIDKSSNNAILENSQNIENDLSLIAGLLDIGVHTLTIESTGNISNAGASAYVRTSSTGVLIQNVNASDWLFPVGNNSYTPITINNAGVVDDYQVRVENIVYEDGNSGSAILTDVVDVTWFVNELLTGGSDVTLTPQWNASDELTDFDRSQAFLAEYEGGSWLQYTTQAASGMNPYTISESNISSFSPFTVSSDFTVLPVELLYFSAKAYEDKALLEWQTATEIDNDYFDIEWSTNGKVFKTLGRVKGAGTTLDKQDYQFWHDQPIVGTNYYRLKQVDFDQTFEYSKIIALEWQASSKASFTAFPNPTSSELFYQFSDLSSIEKIQLYNATGNLLYDENRIDGQLNLKDLQSGIYFLVLTANAKQYQVKIIKQ